jgi:hypothetical protein
MVFWMVSACFLYNLQDYVPVLEAENVNRPESKNSP